MTTVVKIPRATCQLFGAIKALSTIKKSTILVHGPKGCVYHINYIMGMRGDRPSAIYTTCLDEKDVIFGAEQKLVLAIEDIDAEEKPELIFVLSCCASSIIGEDVESAVREAHTDARVVGIESGGFEGDFRSGYAKTLRKLVQELVQEPVIVDPHSVNLIGMLRGGPDLRELKRLLGMAGVTVNGVLTADTSKKEIENLASAALNIVVCEPAGLDAAELLKSRFEIPYIIEEIPIGYIATDRFVRTITETLNLPPYDAPVCEERVFRSVLLEHRKIAIVSGPTRAISMTRFLIELGIEPSVIAVDFDSDIQTRLAALVGSRCEILIEPEQHELVDALKRQGVDLIIGGLLERPVAAALGIEHLDMMHGSQKTVGCRGTDHLITLLERLGP
jgi:light-independent protochlorophyllide reductase B subunit